MLRVYSAFVRRLSGYASAGRNREGPSPKGASRFDPLPESPAAGQILPHPFSRFEASDKMVWENKSYPNLNHLAEKAFLLEEVPGSPLLPRRFLLFSGRYRRVSVPIGPGPREDRMTRFRLTGIGLRGLLREFSSILAYRVSAGSHGTRTPQKPRSESCFPLRLRAGYKFSSDVVRIQVIVFSMEAIPLFFQGCARERFRPSAFHAGFVDG